MFDVGFWELLIIALLALLVLGPERLPGIVKTAGNWAGRARFMARSLRMQVEQEMARDIVAKREAEADARAKANKAAKAGGEKSESAPAQAPPADPAPAEPAQAPAPPEAGHDTDQRA